MTFRSKLLAIVLLTVVAAVTLVSWGVAATTRRAFERIDSQRSAALLAQFRREYASRGEEVVSRVEAVAAAPSTLQLAIDLTQPEPDYAQYLNTAQQLALTHGLDFLDLVDQDGRILSSAQWPARFGYKEDWVAQAAEWKTQQAFLRVVELPEESALAQLSVSTVTAGDRKLYVVGGSRLDKGFVETVLLPPGMRALLFRENAPPDPALQPLVAEVRRQRREVTATIGDETHHAIPLMGRQKNLLGLLLVASSRRELAELLAFIRRMAVLAGGAGILLAVILSWWATARVTRPVHRLAEGAREVAAGNWNARVDVASRDEIGELARAFNQMIHQLLEQRDRLLQAERVAAWRELARRLAHELKNPLFPLQITIENLQRARGLHAEQFDEVFRESAATLLAEVANLKRIIGQFSDFAKMPPPELQRVEVNEIVRGVMRLFEAQLRAPGRPAITAKLELSDGLPFIQADPEQLSRALRNLVLNALDAMPSGGALTIRTRTYNGAVRLEVSDTGAGLTKEECERLFTPYYTTKEHGTGLGLAIVQSVVSDHHGRIAVESEPGRGTTFQIDLRIRK